MKTYHFTSRFAVDSQFADFSQDEVKNEPMIFNADVDIAYRIGGPITRAFLEAVSSEFHAGRPIFDSRVHMLMPGWIPCIPGWHHDDVPRSRPDGQPNYDTPEYDAKHCLGLVNGDIAPTEFVIGSIDLPYIQPGAGPVYKHWHDMVETAIDAGLISRYSAPSNRVIYFDSRTFHRGVVARRGGWRWFGRMSVDTGRQPTNEIRKQVQVYLPVPTEGW